MVYAVMQIITPFHIYFNTYFIFQKLELWRLLTNFLYFGSLSEALSLCTNAPWRPMEGILACTCRLTPSFADLDFVFHMFFLVKYCKTLEEGSFRGRSDEFLWMLLFGKRSLFPSLSPCPCMCGSLLANFQQMVVCIG